MQVAKDRIAALVILAAAAFGWLQTEHIPPEPRFFPRAILVLIGVLALASLARTFLRGDRSELPSFVTNGRAFLLITGMTLGLIWLISTIGFFTAGALFLAVFTISFGYRNLAATALTGSIFLGGLYFIFVWLLKRPLPPELILGMAA